MVSPFVSSNIRSRSFAEILDEIGTESEAEAETATRGFSASAQPGWWSSLFATEIDAGFDIGAGAAAYSEIEADPLISRLAPADEDMIAAELDLASVRTLAELAQARRAFALHNHPDRFRAHLRAIATARMQLANMLFDRRAREIKAGR